eukprot:6060532-Pyramimonas_sp.AAC.1
MRGPPEAAPRLRGAGAAGPAEAVPRAPVRADEVGRVERARERLVPPQPPSDDCVRGLDRF